MTMTRNPIAKRRQLDRLYIAESSGVDYPANRTQMTPDGTPVDGWIVMKRDGTRLSPAEVDELIARVRKAGTVSVPDASSDSNAGLPQCPQCGSFYVATKGTDGRIRCPQGHLQAEPASSTAGVAMTARAPFTITKGAVWRSLEHVAEDLRRADPTLTRAQAVAKAAEQRPELAAAYTAAAPDPLPAPIRRNAPVPAPELEAIERAATRLRDRDPGLSHAQAVARAVEADPALAAAYYARRR